MKKFFRMTALAVLALVLFAGCKQDVGDEKGGPIPGESISTFAGTWVNDDNGWHSEYFVSETEIKDCSMNCEFNVVSSETFKSKDGYTLVFTQCTKGTQWTPSGNYYAIALKLVGGKLEISCPIDYSRTYTFIEGLKASYSENYDVAGNGNYATTCELKGAGKSPVTVTDDEYYSCQVKFEENKVALYQKGNAGFTEYSYATFIPKRDKSKETGSVKLYLYSETDRSLVGDMLYVKITKTTSGNEIYYFLYDEEEDENDLKVSSCNEFLPAISDEEVAKIKSLYE